MTRASSDAVWRGLVELVLEMLDDRRRDMSDAAGLPFGRVRVLRRLRKGPRTLRELALATSCDAPATTVLVNDLERRGLVARKPHPQNRRAKLVSLTAAGRALVARTQKLIERPPAGFSGVAPGDVAALARIVDALAQGRVESAERALE